VAPHNQRQQTTLKACSSEATLCLRCHCADDRSTRYQSHLAFNAAALSVAHTISDAAWLSLLLCKIQQDALSAAWPLDVMLDACAQQYPAPIGQRLGFHHQKRRSTNRLFPRHDVSALTADCTHTHTHTHTHTWQQRTSPVACSQMKMPQPSPSINHTRNHNTYHQLLAPTG